MTFPQETRLAIAINDLADEVSRAMKLHAPQHSPHEAYAIIKEELDEFWDEVKKKQQDRDAQKMYTELLHVAAMAMRAMVDLKLGRLPLSYPTDQPVRQMTRTEENSSMSEGRDDGALAP